MSSKLLKQYNTLKSIDKNKVYIFKVGIFYNILNEDAKIVSDKIGLRLTDLGPNIIKCGFPLSSIEKYSKILDANNIHYEIVEYISNTEKKQIKDIINELVSLDLNNTSCKKAYDILYNIQIKLKSMK